MIQASKAGFLFRSTDKIKADYPQIPAYETYEELAWSNQKGNGEISINTFIKNAENRKNRFSAFFNYFFDSADRCPLSLMHS